LADPETSRKHDPAELTRESIVRDYRIAYRSRHGRGLPRAHRAQPVGV